MLLKTLSCLARYNVVFEILEMKIATAMEPAAESSKDQVQICDQIIRQMKYTSSNMAVSFGTKSYWEKISESIF